MILATRRSIEFQDLNSLQVLHELSSTKIAQDVHFLNSYNIGLAIIRGEYGELLAKSGMNLIDGLILLRTMQFWSLRKPRNQIRGADFLRAGLSNSPKGKPYFQRHCFLGSTDNVLSSLEQKCREINPEITTLFISPPFSHLEDMDLLGISAEIRSFEPQIIWVGLGTPKQDYVARFLREELGLHVVAVGAAFDFLAGSRIESSERMRRFGLEWLTRLIEEPKRLWKRYLVVSPISLVYPFFISLQIRSYE